jgi:predicted nucleotidyltransferase
VERRILPQRYRASGTLTAIDTLLYPAYFPVVMKTALQLAQEYASLVRAKLGSHVKGVILFGSQARGDATEKSDYDLLVVLDKKTPSNRDAVLDTGTEMLNRYDRLFAALIYDEQEWSRTRRFPIGWNIEQEGVAV